MKLGYGARKIIIFGVLVVAFAPIFFVQSFAADIPSIHFELGSGEDEIWVEFQGCVNPPGPNNTECSWKVSVLGDNPDVQALSHTVIGLGTCLPFYVDLDPNDDIFTVINDPSGTGVTGIKFDFGISPGNMATLTVTLITDDVVIDHVTVGVKAAQQTASGLVNGPKCNGVPPEERPIGGVINPIDTTVLLVAGIQTNFTWIIPIALSAAGIGVVLVRKKF